MIDKNTLSTEKLFSCQSYDTAIRSLYLGALRGRNIFSGVRIFLLPIDKTSTTEGPTNLAIKGSNKTIGPRPWYASVRKYGSQVFRFFPNTLEYGNIKVDHIIGQRQPLNRKRGIHNLNEEPPRFRPLRRRHGDIQCVFSKLRRYISSN